MAVAFSENRGVYTSVQGLSNLPSGTPTTGGLTCVTDQNIGDFAQILMKFYRNFAKILENVEIF